MDPTQDSGTSGWQTLASVLAGGLGGYVDAQNHQPVYVSTPAPQTAYGYAGVQQSVPSGYGAATASPAMLIIIGIVVVAFVAMKK